MRLSALLKQRCPHCLQGQVFSSVWKMNATCPNCGIKFEREDGYFMMSVFIGYVISAAIVLPVCLLMYLLGATLQWYFISSMAVIILLTPLIFRYARLIWMHLDEVLDPRPET